MNDVIAILRVVLALVALAWIGMLVWRKYSGKALPMFRSLAWQPNMPRREQARVCPQLGLASDPFASSPRPDEEHRCYANLARERIDLGHQQRFCLASTYKRCPFLAVAPQEDGVSARARTWWRSVSPAFGSAAISLQPWLSARLEALAARVMAIRVQLPKKEVAEPSHGAIAVADPAPMSAPEPMSAP